MEDEKKTLPDPSTTTTSLETSTAYKQSTEPNQPLEDSFDYDWEIVDENLKTVEVDFKIREQSEFKIQPPSLESTGPPSDKLEQEHTEETPKKKYSTVYTGKLKLVVVKATDLKKTDLFQKADPYVIVSFGGQTSKSNKIKNTLNPEWNHEVMLDLNPSSPRDINVQLFDWDRFGKDD